MGSKAPRPRGAGRKFPSPAHRAVNLTANVYPKGVFRLTERGRMKLLWIGIVLVALALAAPAAAAAPGAPAAPQAAAVTATYTLYGNATGGWGFTVGTITEPGPTITASVGENVTLRLYSGDGATHSWFLSLDGSNSPASGEPASPNFNSGSTPVVYSFTVPSNVRTFLYKCGIHPTTMTGSFVIVAAADAVLYGSATGGWGTTSSTITNPGPTLAATQGQPFEIALYSEDGATHQFFVSYDGAQTPSAGEPASSDFNSSLVPVFLTFTPSQSGNFSYYCKYHPSTMKGTIDIASTGSPAAPPSYTLYAVVIVVVVIVAIAAAIVIRRKPRSPPAQPPASPPGPG